MLLLLTFISLFLFNKIYFPSFFKEYGMSKTILIFSTLIVIITEFLSIFNLINLLSIIIFWSLITIMLLLFLLKRKRKLKKYLISSINHQKNSYRNYSLFQRTIIFVLFLFSIIIFFQGVLYPPNNWDSLTYHMSRIMYWIGNESVDHFPTHILRHLYQPPFSEFCILHFNLIQGNDYFSNNLQLVFLLLSLFLINSILKKLNVSVNNRLIILVLTISIPSVVLQASTTKNDIICGYFVLSTILYSINILTEQNFKNFLFLGMSIGLGMLTKGTFYIFALPLILFILYVFLKSLIKDTKFNIIINGLFAVIIIIVLNFGHFRRNYRVNNDILNIDETEGKMYSNSKMNFSLLSSNILKNSGLHLGYPIDTIGDKLIRKINNNYIGVDLNNADTNYLNIDYEGRTTITTHEDAAPNTYHFIIVFLSIILGILINFFKMNKKILLLLGLIIIQFVLFCGFLKWQPWHTRLHIPLFMVSMLLIGVLIDKYKFYKLFIILSIPFSLCSFCFYTFYNNLRPLVTNTLYTKNIKISDKRSKKYFSNQLYLYNDYSKAIDLINQKQNKKIGLIMSDWEYPLLSNCYYEKKEMYSINVGNITSKIEQKVDNVDIIISNLINKEFIEFNGKRYYNNTLNNQYIWAYQ